jgi:hypothetical protein
MSLLQFILAYFAMGSLCGLSFELLMDSTELNDDTTALERISWIVFWPFFVLIFLWGMFK